MKTEDRVPLGSGGEFNSPRAFLVASGALEEASLSSLLEVLCLGRQLTAIELLKNGAPSGSLVLKAGRLLAAFEGASSGYDAFLSILRADHDHYVVYRLPTPPKLSQPIGQIYDLLQQYLATETAKVSQSHAEAVRADQKPQESADFAVAPQERQATEPPAPVEDKAVEPPAVESPAVEPAPQPARRRDAQGAKVLAVSSPKGGCGKTTISLNLAYGLAKRGHSVILVDADINSGVMHSLDAGHREHPGLFEVLDGKAQLDQALMSTALGNFRILPATGGDSFAFRGALENLSTTWPELIHKLATQAAVVVIDTNAGVFGPTLEILKGCTHMVEVLQAQPLALRHFLRSGPMFKGLLDDSNRPLYLGLCLNMVDAEDKLTLALIGDLPDETLLSSSVPRSSEFIEASHSGLPLQLHYEDLERRTASSLADLAAEVEHRLGLPAADPPRKRLLLDA